MANGTLNGESRASFWLRIFERLGLPVAILCFLGYGGWVGARWLGTEIIVPMFNRQMEFIDKVETSVDEVAKAAAAANADRNEMVHQLQMLSTTSAEQTAVLEDIKAELKKQ